MPGYNRWFVPPAALSIHLAIGEVYAFSVFNLPLVEASGGAWTLADVGWIFSIAIVALGFPQRRSALGSNASARGRPCSPPRCASAAGS